MSSPTAKLGRPETDCVRLLTSCEARLLGAPHSWRVVVDGQGQIHLLRARRDAVGLEEVALSPQQRERVRARLEAFWGRDQNHRGVYVRGDAEATIRRLRDCLRQVVMARDTPPRTRAMAARVLEDEDP